MDLPGYRFYGGEWIVGENVWRVKFVRFLQGNMGECDTEEKIMYITYGQPRGTLLGTFIHELIHAIEDEYDIDITKRNIKLKHSHQLVEKLEEALSAFVMNNLLRLCVFPRASKGRPKNA